MSATVTRVPRCPPLAPTAAALVLVIVGALLPGAVRAADAGSGMTVVASDASGVTVRFQAPEWRLVPVDRPEGRFFRIDAPGLTGSTDREGRPLLPAAGSLVGVPPDAEAVVRVVEETFTPVDPARLEGREPEPIGRSEFVPDGKTLSPSRAFHRDAAFYEGTAPWPALTAELGAAGAWRFQRVVPLRILPFRWDPAGRSLKVLTAAVVRIDFVRRGATARPGVARAVAGPRHDRGFEGAYEKALLNYEAAREFRAAPAPPVRARRGVRDDSGPLGVLGPSGTGSLAGGPAVGPEWAVRVDTTGVWRVTYAQLAARGFTPGVATTALSLAYRAYAGDVTPPYVRVEVPIRVLEGAAGAAGTFDADDAIEFYGQSWRERARPSDFRARFGEHETYYLGALPAGTGARMAEVSGDLALAAPVRPTSFPSYRLYEKRHNFIAIPRDTCSMYLTWTELVDAEWSDTLTTFTPDPDPAGQVRFRASFQGVLLSPSSHTIWMRWKRPSDGLLTPVFTETFFSKDAYSADTVFAADRIAAGTNRLEWRGFAPNPGLPDGGVSGASLRSYEVTYDRFYRAFANRLEFNSDGAEGDVEIEVDGFTGATAPAVQVYDVTDSTAPRAILVPAGFVRSTGTNTWAAKFQVLVAPGERRRFFAFVPPPVLPDAAVRALARENAFAVWDPPGTPDFLLVTPEEFLPQARQLATHRRSQGFDVLVAPMGEIADAYDGGRRTDWSIRRLLEDAFARWGSRFVLLLGDGTEDPRNFLAESEKDWVPAHLINGPVGTGNGQELSASDFWFVSDLDRSQPVPPACTNLEPDLFADMAIGRIPAGSLAEAAGLADKVVDYDTQDREGAWRRRFLLVPDDPYSFGSFFGEVQSQYCYKFEEEVFENIDNVLEEVLVDEAGYRDLDIDHFRLREELLPVGRPVPGSGSLCVPVSSTSPFGLARDYVQSTTAPRFRTNLGEGALVVNFQGHGSSIVLAHETLYQSFRSAQDIEFVFNEHRPFFFLSFSCHVNQFSRFFEKREGDGLGENILIGPRNPARPQAGAIASYASTNYELLPADFSGRNHLNTHLFRSLFVDPPSDPLLGVRGARVLLGEALNLGSARAQGQLFGLERRAVQTYLLLGDPATSLNLGAPSVYATANDQAVTSGVRYQPGAEGDSIVFVLDLVDESRIDEIQLSVTGEGARTVDPSEYVFTPSYPDTANGGAGRRYQLTWTVAPEAKDAELVVSMRDRTGLASSFRLPLALQAALFANGQPILNGDSAPAAGTFQFVVSSPAQLTAADLTLLVDGVTVPEAVILPAATDSSRRLWTVTWEGAYPTGTHEAVLAVAGGATRRVTFNTSSVPVVALRNVFAFPSPFSAAPVTFNFTIVSDGPTDVMIKVYSVAGSLVYQREEQGLNPGYHQLLWDGADLTGDPLANGAYTYQVIASSDRGLHAVERGRLARVR